MARLNNENYTKMNLKTISIDTIAAECQWVVEILKIIFFVYNRLYENLTIWRPFVDLPINEGVSQEELLKYANCEFNIENILDGICTRLCGACQRGWNHQLGWHAI